MSRFPDAERRARRSATALAVLGALCAAAAADAAEKRLVVGTKHTPPFAIQRDDGSWTGLSIELWRYVAEDLGLEFELVEMDLEHLLDGLESGALDAVAAAVTVTARREQRLDFSHPFYASGLGIAVSAADQKLDLWDRITSTVFSFDFLRVVLALAGVLMLAGSLVWVFERRGNSGQFARNPGTGLADGFWWSAVTMTTVGYGDKAPRTVGGRMVALVWMFSSVILISSFTAGITSTLTVDYLKTEIKGLEDLPGKTVATVNDSTSEGLLLEIGAKTLAFENVSEAADAVARGEAKAVVYDEPILRHLAIKEHAGELLVLPATFSVQDYAFGLPSGSALRERINRAMLPRIRSPEWSEQLSRFVGRR